MRLKDEEEEEEKHDAPILPIAISNIDDSHRRSVMDLKWLPANMEITHRGEIKRSNERFSHQFITVSPDGQVSNPYSYLEGFLSLPPKKGAKRSFFFLY